MPTESLAMVRSLAHSSLLSADGCSMQLTPVRLSSTAGHTMAPLIVLASVLKRVYPDAIAKANYSTVVNSVAFAGTIVGMLSFGYISDKVGRKCVMPLSSSRVEPPPDV